MEEELLKKIDEISDEMISGIKRIVQIDSVQSEAKPGMPFGEGVNKALEEALKLACELGFETENVDHMVGNPLHLRFCGLGRADVHPAINLHGVRGDHFSV